MHPYPNIDTLTFVFPNLRYCILIPLYVFILVLHLSRYCILCCLCNFILLLHFPLLLHFITLLHSILLLHFVMLLHCYCILSCYYILPAVTFHCGFIIFYYCCFSSFNAPLVPAVLFKIINPCFK